LNQLRQASDPSVGKPEKFSKLSWSDFVQHVLALTVKGYQAMRAAKIAQCDWEENIFTIQLGENYLRPLAFDEASPIRVMVRTKRHTEDMKVGKQSTLEAKEIDLMVFAPWEREYHEKHFVWEAKLVGDKRVNKKYSYLNAEYVNEAIYRFIDKEYAGGLDNAGVLGYVLEGLNIIRDINNTMSRIRKNLPLSQSNHLRPTQAIYDFKEVYLSHHKRTDSTKIQLHHLFLTFDFV